jgi:hypothetical protein
MKKLIPLPLNSFTDNQFRLFAANNDCVISDLVIESMPDLANLSIPVIDTGTVRNRLKLNEVDIEEDYYCIKRMLALDTSNEPVILLFNEILRNKWTMLLPDNVTVDYV